MRANEGATTDEVDRNMARALYRTTLRYVRSCCAKSFLLKTLAFAHFRDARLRSRVDYASRLETLAYSRVCALAYALACIVVRAHFC